MEGTDDDVSTFTTITGAPEPVAKQILQLYDGDLNQAVNHFIEFGAPQDPDPDSDLSSFTRNNQAEAVRLSPVLEEPSGSFQIQQMEGDDDDIGGTYLKRLGGQPSAATWHPTAAHVSDFRTLPEPVITHPREIREIPIDWKEGDEDDEHSARLGGRVNAASVRMPGGINPWAPLIQEVPAATAGSTANTPFLLEEDEEEWEEAEAKRRGRAVGGSGGREVSFRDWGRPRGAVEEEEEEEGEEVVGGRGGEDEMLRAALEASRKLQQKTDLSVPPNGAVSTGGADEDNDAVARALALSIQTAQEEQVFRRLAGVGEAEGEDLEMREQKEEEKWEEADTEMTDWEEGRGEASRKRTGLSRAALQDEGSEEDEMEAPSLRRPVVRFAGRQRSVWSHGMETFGGTGAVTPPPGENSGAPFSVEGVTEAEAEEAKMLEATMFGVPYVPSRGTGPLTGSLTGVDPFFQTDDYMDGGRFGGTGAVPWNASRPAERQSPDLEVVEQRLIREQQDDEFLASLAADREKEELAKAEVAERRKREEEEGEERERAEREEKERREELQRQLAIKRASLPSEPPASATSALTVQVRMPDGSKKSRRFLRTDPMQSLFDYIDVSDELLSGTYRLVQMYPRRPYLNGSEEVTKSFLELGLTSKLEALVLEPV